MEACLFRKVWSNHSFHILTETSGWSYHASIHFFNNVTAYSGMQISCIHISDEFPDTMDDLSVSIIWKHPKRVPDFTQVTKYDAVLVTFTVDLNNNYLNITGSPQVFVAGTFNGWCTTCDGMQETDTLVYHDLSIHPRRNRIQICVQIRKTIIFIGKYYQSRKVAIKGECRNRFNSVFNDSLTLEPVCFQMCTPCPIPTGVTVYGRKFSHQVSWALMCEKDR